MSLIHITTLEDRVVYSNVPTNFNFQDPKAEVSTVLCQSRKINRRQIIITGTTFKIYFASYDENITNKIFKHYVDSIKDLLPVLLKASEEVLKLDIQKSKRLKHNLVNHTSKIHQELYRLVSQDDLQKSRQLQLEKIEDAIKKRPRDAAYIYLRVLKSINFMKAEFDVYEMLHTPDPFLDFNKHLIHKVIMLALTPFWLDFLENNITISIEPSAENILIDYKSFSVGLSHIFDNAIKYCAPGSEVFINFNRVENWFIIYFTMTSLQLEDDELKNIFVENYSGKWAQKLDVAGTGIGMFVIDKLIKLNKGTVEFKSNIDPTIAFKRNGVPYCINQLIINL